MDRQLEEGQGATQGAIRDLARGNTRRHWSRGRPPGQTPDARSIATHLLALVQQRFAYLNGLFNGLPDKRHPDDCLYSTATILWMVVLGFLCRKSTRNAMDAYRNDGFFPENLHQLSCQKRWPTGRPVTAPCTQTATRLLDILAPGGLEGILIAVAYTLLRAKVFDGVRLGGRILIAIDGTKQENYRRWFVPWRRKYRYVLHAKIIGPCGTAFTVLAEPCDHYDTERGKLDCELQAFYRLAIRLKAAFPRLPICLIGDALFCCEKVFDLCEKNHWKFVFTLKEGKQPSAFDEMLQLLPEVPGNVTQRTWANGRQDTRWVTNVRFKERVLAVVLQGEVEGPRSFFCVWATNLLIAKPERARAIADAGRWRSHIEESYNVQKNGGFGLEHAFRETNRGAANYHLLMQLAHTLWQLLSKGVLHRLFAKCRKVTDIAMAELLNQFLHTQAPPKGPLPTFQLRFADG